MNTELETIANKRTSLHQGGSNQRILSKDHDIVGFSGEREFGRKFGLSPDTSERINGDNGVDFVLPIGTVDVKTYRKPYNLLHEKGKPHADILVLAQYNDETKSATLIGWEWATDVEKWPFRDFGYGIINHYMSASRLRPMEDLENLVKDHAKPDFFNE